MTPSPKSITFPCVFNKLGNWSVILPRVFDNVHIWVAILRGVLHNLHVWNAILRGVLTKLHVWSVILRRVIVNPQNQHSLLRGVFDIQIARKHWNYRKLRQLRSLRMHPKRQRPPRGANPPKKGAILRALGSRKYRQKWKWGKNHYRKIRGKIHQKSHLAVKICKKKRFFGIT